jgi:hypothetical protein
VSQPLRPCGVSLARSLVLRFSKARRKSLGLILIVSAVLVVPVAYDAWFIANFGLDARVFRAAPSGYSAVLLVEPDALWKLWVRYSSVGGSSGWENLSATIGSVGYGDIWGIGTQPPMISRAAGTSVNVLYSFTWINWTPKPHGFFWLTVTDICQPIPVAIGVSASQVNASDFPGLGMAINCRVQFFSVTIQAYSGMEILYLQTSFYP